MDVRPAEDFAKGHVPGAINLPIDVLFRPASLAKLPARGQAILLVCQSGHTESMALGGLAALGYEPWAMRFGMIGWNAETNVKAGSPLQGGDPSTASAGRSSGRTGRSLRAAHLAGAAFAARGGFHRWSAARFSSRSRRRASVPFSAMSEST